MQLCCCCPCNCCTTYNRSTDTTFNFWFSFDLFSFILTHVLLYCFFFLNAHCVLGLAFMLVPFSNRTIICRCYIIFWLSEKFHFAVHVLLLLLLVLLFCTFISATRLPCTRWINYYIYTHRKWMRHSVRLHTKMNRSILGTAFFKAMWKLQQQQHQKYVNWKRTKFEQ